MELDPIPQAVSDDPHPVYSVLREEHPVHYVPDRDLWILSRHEDVLGAIKAPETFSSGSGVVPSGFKPEQPTASPSIRRSTPTCARP